ncbi:MAG: hypothetical protein WC222_11300 [Parachlamydiales bacterium]|jgi:hypothetical protein
MNIVQIVNKTDFYLDSERSPRFEPKQRIKAVNSAINDILLNRYDNIKKGPKEKEYAFQTAQRLRDELYTLVRYQASIAATGTDLIAKANFPTDYMFLLLLEASISGQIINTIPLTYDELNVVQLNPYYRPSITWPQRIYRIESNEGIKVVYGSVGRLISANMYYIKKPATVSLGTEVNDNTVHFNTGDTIIAYVASSLAIVVEGTASILLDEEESYVIGTNGETDSWLDSGIVYQNPVETDLPETLHEEICRIAAKILSGNVENYNREMSLDKDIKQQ